MGTDIHMTVEVQLDPDDKFWKPLKRTLSVKEDWSSERHMEHDWYPHRNYNDFAMLADVRNGHGFAGVDTGDALVPILTFLGEPEPTRGLPGGDDGWSSVEEHMVEHTPTWITLGELLRAQHDGYFEQTVRHRGVCYKKALPDDARHVGERDGRDHYELTKPPSSYAGDIHGPPATELASITWTTTYEEVSRIPQLIDELCAAVSIIRFPWKPSKERGYPTIVRPGGDAMDHWDDVSDRVRLVFFFDS